MTNRGDLKVGSFYWVLITFDPDEEESWVNDVMPARLRGFDANDRPLWNYLDCDESDWPVRWIGDEIIPPPLN